METLCLEEEGYLAQGRSHLADSDPEGRKSGVYTHEKPW